MEKDKIYLKHIHDSILAIESDLKGITFDKFSKNRLLQSAVIRELEIIGEAAKILSSDFKKFHPEIPWKKIMGMRDKLIHGYFSIELELVWEAAKEKIPELKNRVRKMISDEL